jgi:sugar-specific transcriptional regulator TrmB
MAKLREFGLSEYAARTYLALLDLGTTEARDVAALSKVPASKIYHVLDQLHEKGLVVILPEFPRKYAPVPFGEFLEKLHEKHESMARTLREDRESLLEMFAVVGDTTSGDRGTLTLLRGRRNVLERFDEMLAGAEREVLLLCTPGLLLRLRAWAPAIQEASRRGARIRLLVPSDAPAGLSSLPAEARVRHVEGPGERGALLVADGQHALLVHFLPDDGHGYEGTDTAVYTDKEGVVAVLASLAEAPWVHAPPFAAGHPVQVASGEAVGIPLRE